MWTQDKELGKFSCCLLLENGWDFSTERWKSAPLRSKWHRWYFGWSKIPILGVTSTGIPKAFGVEWRDPIHVLSPFCIYRWILFVFINPSSSYSWGILKQYQLFPFKRYYFLCEQISKVFGTEEPGTKNHRPGFIRLSRQLYGITETQMFPSDGLNKYRDFPRYQLLAKFPAEFLPWSLRSGARTSHKPKAGRGKTPFLSPQVQKIPAPDPGKTTWCG